jgi:stage V sporulation protein B
MALSPIVKQLAFRSAIVLLIKIIGALVRIPLFRWLGAEGVGLYQIIYSFYGLILTIVTGGIPTALTLITAKDERQGLRMLQASIILLALLGGAFGLLMHSLADNIAALLGDSRLQWAVRFIALALFIVPILSLIRGFLQGIEYYSVIALSELVEQVFRVSTMLIFVTLWIRHSVGLAVGGAALGAVIGASIALFFLLIVLMNYIRKVEPTKNPIQMSFSFFLRTSIAITASRFIMPLADFLDAIIIPHRLQHAGLTSEAATAIFGIFSGMAASVVYMPTLVSSAVSHIFAAKITSDWKNGHWDRYYRRSKIIIQRGWLWGLGCSIYFFLYHAELSQLLFGNLSASKAILYMCAAPLVSGMRELSTMLLWAKDSNKAPMVGLLLGIVISSALGYILVGLPHFSLEGTAIELLSLELISFLWNFYVLQQFHLRLFSFLRLLFETLGLLIYAFICYFAGGIMVSILQLTTDQSILFEMGFPFVGIFGYVLIRHLFVSFSVRKK